MPDYAWGGVQAGYSGGINEMTESLLRPDETVLLQPIVGLLHRRDADTEFSRQGSYGRQRVMHREAVVDDGDADLAPDLLLQALLGGAVDLDPIALVAPIRRATANETSAIAPRKGTIQATRIWWMRISRRACCPRAALIQRQCPDEHRNATSTAVVPAMTRATLVDGQVRRDRHRSLR